MRRVWSSWLTLAMAGALSACGGGGGRGSSTTSASLPAPPPPPPPAPSPVVPAEPLPAPVPYPRTGTADFVAEETRNWGLAAIGALGTQAAGGQGGGITVGLVDTGIDLNHPDFAGAIAPASTNIVTGKAADVQDITGHGTLVAGVVGARKDGYDGLGVAPQTTLLAIRSDLPGTCPSACSFNDGDLARATDYAVANGAKIINFSLGGAAISPTFQTALTNATSKGVIVVAAAGNTGGADPIDPAKTVAGSQGNGLGLAVGAVDSGNTLAAFSNKAGAVMDHYLVAPGVGITGTGLGGGVVTGTGTSFAAPHVSGAAAVVWGASPFLTGKQVVDILLATATDLGAPGVDPVYGHGLVDLQAALQPVGTPVVPAGATVSQGGSPISSTWVASGAALGDSLSRAATPLKTAAVFDSFGRPFATDLSGAVRPYTSTANPSAWAGSTATTTQVRSGPARLSLTSQPDQPADAGPPGRHGAPSQFSLTADLGGGGTLGLSRGAGLSQMTGLTTLAGDAQTVGTGGDVLGSPFLDLAGTDTAMTAGMTAGRDVSLTVGFGQSGGALAPSAPSPLSRADGRHAIMAEAVRRWDGGTATGLHAGLLTEQSGPLASSGSGPLAFGNSAATRFLGVFGATPWDDRTTLFGRYDFGLTDGGGLGYGLLRDFSNIPSQSFALGANLRDALWGGDLMTLTLSRPLQVVGGNATLAVPVGRTMDGMVLYSPQRIGLAPSGAETDLQMGWSMATAAGTLTMGGGLMLEPGHMAGASLGTAAGLKYRLTW